MEGLHPLVTRRRPSSRPHVPFAIVAIPPTLAGRIDYDPPMPGLRDQLTQRVPQGSVIKCFAFYERPFWRDRGLSGNASGNTAPVQVVSER